MLLDAVEVILRRGGVLIMGIGLVVGAVAVVTLYSHDALPSIPLWKIFGALGAGVAITLIGFLAFCAATFFEKPNQTQRSPR